MDLHATMIGVPVAQVQGPDKVTGRQRVADDMEGPGRLWGKLLGSPHLHARIRRIAAAAPWRTHAC
jgi:CO/xanthine dehydrogenase Mo-binding subunit